MYLPPATWLDRVMLHAFPPTATAFWLTHHLRDNPRFWGVRSA